MDDLRRRFAALDTIQVPQTWRRIERRAEELRITAAPTESVVHRGRPYPGRLEDPRRVSAGRFAIAAVAIAVVVAAGSLVTSAWLDSSRTPVPGTNPPVPTTATGTPATTATGTPSPTPTTTPATTATLPAAFDCDAARTTASRRTTGWQAGPPPGPIAAATNGQIAIWNSDTVPAVLLVDPATGATCTLVTFDGYRTRSPRETGPDTGARDWIPVRGALAWSPDGTALAMVVVDDERGIRDLFVWSAAGLAGPMIDGLSGQGPAIPTWSPGGSRIALIVGTASVDGPDRSLVWVVARDASVPRQVLVDCARCSADTLTWSPDGESFAVVVRAGGTASGLPAGFAVGKHGDIAIPILPNTRFLSEHSTLLGWTDETTLRLNNIETGRFADLPTRGGNALDRGPTGLPPHGRWSPSLLSPDRTTWASVDPVPGDGDVDPSFVFSEVVTGRRVASVFHVPEFAGYGWAPDGRSIGYLFDEVGSMDTLWAVGSDGNDHRRVATGRLLLGVDPGPFAWQPVWP